jgi:hypothetical protein
MVPAKFKNRMIDVINRGNGGDEAADEQARFQTDMIEENPSLVITRQSFSAFRPDAQVATGGKEQLRPNARAVRQRPVTSK